MISDNLFLLLAIGILGALCLFAIIAYFAITIFKRSIKQFDLFEKEFEEFDKQFDEKRKQADSHREEVKEAMKRGSHIGSSRRSDGKLP